MAVALPELKSDFDDSRTELRLPEGYTSLPPTKAAIAEYPLQSVNQSHFRSTNPLAEANEWLKHLEPLRDAHSDVNIAQRMSWSGFHSQNAANVTPVKTLSTLLPLLKDSVNSTSMVRHTMDIIKQILLLIHPEQAPVITADQPVYTLGKQIQWMYPDLYREDKLVMMMGGLHIEMAFLDAIGDWLEGSGWAEVLVKAQVNTPGRAESFLSGKQVKRSRYAHQVSCAGLHLLLQDAFVRSGSVLSLELWISAKLEASVQFKYWYTVIELEAILLLLVQSIRQSNFMMFVSALEQLVPWMFALDHTNYSRWLPIFISDLKQLPAKHPKIYDEFVKGNFTSKKTSRRFSSLPEDQAHEQNDKLVKIDGGALGILDNHTSLMKWMVAGPEIARIVKAFEVRQLILHRICTSSLLCTNMQSKLI